MIIYYSSVLRRAHRPEGGQKEFVDTLDMAEVTSCINQPGSNVVNYR